MITNVPAWTCRLGLGTSTFGAPAHQPPIPGPHRRVRMHDFGPAP